MKILLSSFLIMLFFNACAQNNMEHTSMDEEKETVVQKEERDEFDKADAEFDREINKPVSSKRIIKDLSCKLK